MTWRQLATWGEKVLGRPYQEAVDLGITSNWWRDLAIKLAEMNDETCKSLQEIEESLRKVHRCTEAARRKTAANTALQDVSPAPEGYQPEMRVFLKAIQEANRKGFAITLDAHRLQYALDRGFLLRDPIHQQYILTARGMHEIQS